MRAHRTGPWAAVVGLIKLNNDSVYVLVQAVKGRQAGRRVFCDESRWGESAMVGKIIQLSRNPAGFGEHLDALDAEMFDSTVPVQHTHLYYEDDELGLYVGVWDTTSMTEAAGAYPCDEFMWLLEGEAEIENSETGEFEIARAGEAFVIPRGYHCRWRQRGYLRKFFVILEPPSAPIPDAPVVAGIIKPAVSSSKISTEAFPLFGTVAEHWQIDSRTKYLDSTGCFGAGSWTGLPFELESVTTVQATFVYLVQGYVSFDEGDNQQHEFGPGDAFFVPAGTTYSCSGQQKIHLCYATVCI